MPAGTSRVTTTRAAIAQTHDIVRHSLLDAATSAGCDPNTYEVGEPRTQPGRALTVWATHPMTTSTAPYLDDKGPDDTGYRALAPRTGRHEHRPDAGCGAGGGSARLRWLSPR
ncbi:hypothetical protein GCM10027063_28290 [Promicromonospora xylanilytica]